MLVRNKPVKWWINDCEHVLVEHCTDIADVLGSNPMHNNTFSGFIFTTATVVFITEKIAFIFIS